MHSPTPWSIRPHLPDAHFEVVADAEGNTVGTATRREDAAHIVEAVNHYHGAVLNLAKQISLREKLYAELGTLNDVAVNLTRSRDAALADADRLRDIVRRLYQMCCEDWARTNEAGRALLREAREAIVEDKP